ncbi:hypothetical protein BJF79_09805 [Actinomadura sp. CNU-125]|nr:hypothetical protein BJF79_09805 [Actinomadura sp. CNU-125]
MVVGGEVAAGGGPQFEVGVQVGDGGGDLGEVVDQEAVDDAVPAPVGRVREAFGDAGREVREVPAVLDELGAFEVAERGVDRHAVLVHAYEDVLEVRLQDDPVVQVRAQDGRRHVGHVGVPPGECAVGGRQGGEGGEEVAVGVGQGACEEWSAGKVFHALPQDHAQTFVQAPVRECGRAVGGFGQEGRPHGREHRVQEVVQRDRTREFVPRVLADAVGDAHVQAELAEDVGVREVNGPDGRRGHGLRVGRAQVRDHSGVQGAVQAFGEQRELPRVRGDQAAAGTRGRAVLLQRGERVRVALFGEEVLGDGQPVRAEARAGFRCVLQPVVGRALPRLRGRVEPVPRDERLLGRDVPVVRRAGGARAGRDDRGEGGAAVADLREELGVRPSGRQFELARDEAREPVPRRGRPGVAAPLLVRGFQAVGGPGGRSGEAGAQHDVGAGEPHDQVRAVRPDLLLGRADLPDQAVQQRGRGGVVGREGRGRGSGQQHVVSRR